MFDSLSDRIREDEKTKTAGRVIFGVAVLVVAFLLFGGLYLGVRMLE